MTIENNHYHYIVNVLILAASSGFFFFSERLFPYNKNLRWPDKYYKVDFYYYLIFQPFVVGVIITLLTNYIVHRYNIVVPLRLISQWPLWLQLSFFLVTHDFIMYWVHRAEHKYELLWRLHEAHHAPTELNWFNGARSHPIEMLLLQTIEFVPILLLGGSPYLVLYKATVDSVFGQFIHANVSYKLGYLIYFINGPQMHRWHHVDHPAVYHANLTTKFSLWDWLFCTAYLPKDELANNYGLRKNVRDIYPQSYWQQVAFLFRSSKS